jgi:hypothetical protein
VTQILTDELGWQGALIVLCAVNMFMLGGDLYFLAINPADHPIPGAWDTRPRRWQVAWPSCFRGALMMCARRRRG